MANEISGGNNLSCNNADYTASKSNTKTVNQDLQGGWSGIVKVGTSQEDFAPTDITTLGWIWFKNLDDANYIQWGAKDTTMKTIGRAEAGESVCFRMEPGVTLRWIANTAECNIDVLLLED
jgi:hypothetical protein